MDIKVGDKVSTSASKDVNGVHLASLYKTTCMMSYRSVVKTIRTITLFLVYEVNQLLQLKPKLWLNSIPMH